MNTTSAREPQEVPDLILEQYRLGELPRAEADRVSRLLSIDQALRDRHEALEQSDQAFARDVSGWLAGPADPGAAGRAAAPAGPLVRCRSGSPRAARSRFLVMPRAWVDPPARPVASQAPEDRIKGLRPALTIYRRTAERQRNAGRRQRRARGRSPAASPTSAPDGRYGVILSIDGRGVVTLHLPPSGDRAAPLQSGRVTLLDQAYELDDAPGWERFYFVTGDTPFAVSADVEAARKVAAEGARPAPAPLPIGRELSQSTFSLQKEVRR